MSVALFPATSQFGEVRVVQKTPIVELGSNFPISALREVNAVTGTGSVTTVAGERKLAVTAGGVGTVISTTAKRGRYKSGYGAEQGVGIRIPTLPTGTTVARWGYQDATKQDGFYFGCDATGLFIGRTTGGVAQEIERRPDWNVDRFDGTGKSGINLELSDGAIYQIDFTHYGHGIIEFQVVMTSGLPGAPQRTYTVHRLDITGSVSIEQPNLPVFVEIDSGATPSDFAVFIGGRQFSIVGKYEPDNRITPFHRFTVGSVGTTPVHVMSLRKKAVYLGVPTRLSGIDVISSADCLVTVLQNPTLTGASFGTPSDMVAAETSLERDISTTSYTGGIPVWSRLVNATGSGGNASGSASETGLDAEMIEQQPLTVVVRTVSATGATVSVAVRMIEDW